MDRRVRGERRECNEVPMDSAAGALSELEGAVGRGRD